MSLPNPSRYHAGVLLGALLAVSSGPLASAAPHSRLPGQEIQAPAPIERRTPVAVPGSPSSSYPTVPQASQSGGQSTQNRAQRPASGRLPRGQHLAQWMTQHGDLTPEQQQHALGQEPGFSTLTAETQQRYHDRLAQLDALNPEKRERFLARTEAMERLSPGQRADVRSAMGQLGALPMDRRRVVARTFRALRDLPAEQRVPALNSGRFGAPLDAEQRAVLMGLLRVEPMLPPPVRPGAPGSSGVPGTAGQPMFQAPH